MTARPYDLTRWLLLAVLLVLAPRTVLAQTYTSGSTTYSLIDSSTHTKIGFNTTPYRFNGSGSGISCGTAPPILDDTLSDAIPIGFTFTFGTTAHTMVRVMTNGRLQFGNTSCGSGTASAGPPQTYPFGYPIATMNNTMKIFGVDLDPTNLVDRPNYPSATRKTPCLNVATCYVSVATIGTAPARQFVVTWKNVPEWVTATNTSGSFDLQIVLNEDGSFVFQYGNITHGGTGTAQIGWQLTTTNFQVLSFGAAAEPPPFSAIKFFLPAPVATYAFEEGAWLPGLAGQVAETPASARTGMAIGGAQTSSTGRVCRSASIPLNTDASIDAVRTGLNIGNAALNLQGTGTAAFWYRSSAPWSGAGARAAQLLDATATNGEWFYVSKTSAGAVVFVVRDSTGVTRSVSSAAQSFAADTWVHIAVAWNFNGSAAANADALQVFINAGVPTISNFSSSGNVTTQAGVLHVGDNALGIADTQGTLNSAGGLVDELQVFNYVLTQAQVNTASAASRACTGFAFDHIEIQHASGSAITCTPSTLTLRACANASCSTLFTGGVSGTLSATGTPSVNWDGSTGNASGSGFVIPSGSSTVTKQVQITTTGSSVLGIAATSPAVSGANSCNFGSPSCTMTAAGAGFIVTVPNHTADSVPAVSVSAVRTSDNSLACVPAFTSTTKPVNFRCSYVNPASGTLAARVGGTALNASGNAAATCDGIGSSVNLAFDASGVASTTLQYADVGSTTLTARYAPTSGNDANLVMTGAASLVTKPANFALSGIRCTSTAAGQCAAGLPAPGNNPGAAAAAGAAFIPAGRSFSATVTALNASGNATPNFGQETAPEGVRLAASLVLPAGGATPALNNAAAFGSFSSGTATGTTFSWDEVGIITLTPRLTDGDYLGSGDVVGAVSGNVGRFVPARFALSAPALTHRAALACTPASAYTYLDENFRLTMTLTAQNSAGLITTNYTGAFARFDAAAASGWGLAGIVGSTVFSGTSGRLSLGTAAGTWSAGVLTAATLNATALRGSTPDGPFDAVFGVAPTDPDGVALASFDLDTDLPANGTDRATVATVPLRFGRLRLVNTIGAADRPLALPLLAEIWNGTGFALNTLDSCTTVPASAVSLGRRRGSLTAADVTPAGPVTLAAGAGRLQLTAPGGGRSGTLDVALSLGTTATDAACVGPWTPSPAATTGAGLAALRSNWCSSAYVHDPAARATLGRQRTSGSTLYRRENF
ncbi:MAG: hypothetical protein IPF94_12380 [Betaproteobacteria bacterium]|nr:hypothetical protein [Betaproteobacteria bacterium]